VVVARLDDLRPGAPVLDVAVLVEALVADRALRRELAPVLVLVVPDEAKGLLGAASDI
jgi:hypothetical protein